MLDFITRYYKGTINGFISSWGNELRPQIRVVRYRNIPFSKFTPGATIFADLERVRPWESHSAKKLSRRLRATAGSGPILNDPDSYLGKFGLLKLLHREEINDFQVYRLEEFENGTGALKFPVFLRRDLDHRGCIGDLLHSQDELGRVLANLSLRDRLRKKRLMLVEYCDCADAEGVFRKYSAMNVGGVLAPSHTYFSKRWLTKTPELITDSSAREEAEFVHSFPHRKQIAEVFRLAGLEYGRVDYGLKNGKVQVWEINTNPIIVRPRETMDPRRLASQSRSAELIVQALAAMANAPGRA